MRERSSGTKAPLFLIGAGFNAAASVNVPQLGRIISYPLTGDLLEISFPGRKLGTGETIERWFQESIDEGDREPLQRMCDAVLEADHYVTEDVVAANPRTNPYWRFLEAFPRSSFLSFNYDGLVEILLLSRQRWQPMDGFGVNVKAEIAQYSQGRDQEMASAQSVVHLHGSLYVYPRESEISPPDSSGMQWLSMRDAPEFVFDPGPSGHRLRPFERGTMDHNYRREDERIIAPVPSKAKGLEEHFIRQSYDRAREMIAESRELVCIGYSFNPADVESFGTLLQEAGERQLPLTIISPDARQLADRVGLEYCGRVYSFSGTFEEWVECDFPTAVSSDNVSGQNGPETGE